MGLSRDEFLKRDELPTREVPVPEWGEGITVRVRCLTTAERLTFGLAAQKASADGADAGPNPTALIVALAAVDDQGARMFTVQDSDGIASMRGDVIERLASAVMELSGMSETADVDAEENSDATPSGGTQSASDASSDAPPTS